MFSNVMSNVECLNNKQSLSLHWTITCCIRKGSLWPESVNVSYFKAMCSKNKANDNDAYSVLIMQKDQEKNYLLQNVRNVIEIIHFTQIISTEIEL